MNTLEQIFVAGYTKAMLKRAEYIKQQKERWDKDLKKVNEIYNKLSFLNEKGVSIEKVCCTEFNQRDADNGMYPYIRFPQLLLVFRPIHDDPSLDFGGNGNGYGYSGKYSCESFIKRLTKPFL